MPPEQRRRSHETFVENCNLRDPVYSARIPQSETVARFRIRMAILIIAVNAALAAASERVFWCSSAATMRKSRVAFGLNRDCYIRNRQFHFSNYVAHINLRQFPKRKNTFWNVLKYKFYTFLYNLNFDGFGVVHLQVLWLWLVAAHMVQCCIANSTRMITLGARCTSYLFYRICKCIYRQADRRTDIPAPLSRRYVVQPILRVIRFQCRSCFMLIRRRTRLSCVAVNTFVFGVDSHLGAI